MAEVQWIKIYTNMFDISRKIKHIERMPRGDTILVIWFKLLTLAGKINDGGVIYVTPSIPYDIEGLADELRRDEDITEKALSTFEMFDMIERDNGFIYISSWEEYQNIEGLEKIREQNRKRVAKHRKNKQNQDCNVTSNVTCNVTVTECNGIDKEEDKEKDKESDNKKIITDSANPSPSSSSKKSKKEKIPKHKRGEYQHVLLTDEEEEKLIDEFGMVFALKAITFLDEYIEETGYTRKNHYLCIKRWVIDAVKEKEEKAIKKGEVPKARYGDFDVEDAFKLALERSYGEDEQPKTAANDDSVRERMDALKERLGQ